MIINIYGLINPTNNEIIYVGQTKAKIDRHLKEHYWKLNEVKRGKRNWTKLFKFLDDFLPNKVSVMLIKEVDISKPFENADFYERHYINYYRSINPNLLNDANGGIGGNQVINKTPEEKKAIGLKLSNKLKGKKKPKGFGERLSIMRMGKNNPSACPLNPKIAAYKGLELIKVFEYGFEINEFIGKNAYSNVKKALNKHHYSPYGYTWRYIKS